MKPRRPPIADQQMDMYRVELIRIVNPDHAMVKLAAVVNWERLDKLFGKTFCPEKGRPGHSTRLMVALHYLKYTDNLSDERVLNVWVDTPCWQHFSGMKWLAHELPIHPSSMTRWRKRIGEAGAEQLLRETIQAGLRLKIVKNSQLKRVNMDTTVQEKEVRYPTDARLYDRARARLVKAARQRDIPIRQSYVRKAKELVIRQGRYAHARQMKRAAKCTRQLKTYLGRVIRDIERKYPQPDPKLAALLTLAKRIYQRQRHDKNKVYSVHAPEVECISKGKVHKRYEFGCKVSVAATSRGGWFVGAKAFHGNPYDGHTLSQALSQVERIARQPGQVFVDMGYRGHDYRGDTQVHVDKRRRSRTAKSLWRWMKRRAAIEPGIGHLKREHRMDRNQLAGIVGDQMNAILCAAGMNFHKLLGSLTTLLRLFLRWLVH